jgi:3-oxoacyl-[acyl-carrier protein] reductase
MLRINLTGVIACTRAALEPMVRQRRGVVVNIGSVAAGQPSRGQAVYAASKGAVEAFTRAVAVEYGRKGVTCVCVRPGPMDTDMFAPTKALGGDRVLATTPWPRFVPVADVAALVVRLVAGGTSIANGSILTVDGTQVDDGAAR